MRGLKITLFTLGLIVLSTQTFRHIYVKWIEPTESVLDAYRDPVQEDIAATKSLDELEELYAAARKGRLGYEGDNPDVEIKKRSAQQLYTNERELELAIRRLEAQRKSLFELGFYWLCGLLSIALGIFAYRRLNRWLGLVGIIAGFTEMAVWTSPLWRSRGPQGEFDRLLTWKLVLSVVTIVLLITLWLKAEKEAPRAETDEA